MTDPFSTHSTFDRFSGDRTKAPEAGTFRERSGFRNSPASLIVLMAVFVYIAESISELVLHLLGHTLLKPLSVLLDSLILVVLLAPVFYFVLFRPLVYQIRERRFAEGELRVARKKEYRMLVDTTMDAFWLLDKDGGIVDVNPAISRLFGYSREEMLTMKIDDVMRDGDRERINAARSDVVARGFHRFETTCHIKNGRVIEVEISAAYSAADGLIYSFIRDISELKKNERLLRKAKEDLEEEVARRTEELTRANELLALRSAEIEMKNREISAIGKMGELLSACETSDEAYNVIARSASRLFPNGSGALFILNPSHNLLAPACTWGDAPGLHREVDPKTCWALRRGRCYSRDDLDSGLRCTHLPEADVPGSHYCVPLMAQGEALGVFQLMSAVSDGEKDEKDEAPYRLFSNVAEKVEIAVASLRLSETMRNLSLRDPLSGLYNRRFMEESMQREYTLALRDKTSVGIIMFDIDHFKHFNDTFGHEAGDAVIRQLGVFVKQHVRGSDVACRYGGEEFVIIMPGAAEEAVSTRAEDLRSAISGMHVHTDSQVLGPVTISLGLAVFPLHASTLQATLRAADAALYKAKRNGRNRVCVHDGKETLLPPGSEEQTAQPQGSESR
jgi:diguanylate cyclase (GGDEF)-like protein/PAS domain S-box-containing protein